MTVSQVIFRVADLLKDSSTANDEEAKDLAEMVNQNQLIPAGAIPEGTPTITYSRAELAFSLGSRLSLARPNPARGDAVISFAVPGQGEYVSLRIYDQNGRRIRTLVDEQRGSGLNQVSWLGDDDRGNVVPTGIYFYRIKVGERAESRRILLRR